MHTPASPQSKAHVLAHTVLGNGPQWVVFLHGLLGSGRNLSTLARGLVAARTEFSALLADLTGHGASPALTASATLGDLARDLSSTLRALSLRTPVRLVGHSLGGKVALKLALLEPGAVERVVLLDISPRAVDPGRTFTSPILDALLRAPEQAGDRDDMRRALTAQGLEPFIVEWLLTNLDRTESDMRWRVDRGALKRLHDASLPEDLWAAAERLGPRLACIRGARSGFVTEEDSARLTALGSQVVTIEGAGHFVHVEQPQAVLDAVQSLL